MLVLVCGLESVFFLLHNVKFQTEIKSKFFIYLFSFGNSLSSEKLDKNQTKIKNYFVLVKSWISLSFLVDFVSPKIEMRFLSIHWIYSHQPKLLGQKILLTHSLSLQKCFTCT